MKFFLWTVFWWIGTQLLLWPLHYFVWLRYFPQFVPADQFWRTVLDYTLWPLYLVIVWQVQWRNRKR